MNEQGTHFFFMSFVTRNAIGLSVENRSGHWTPEPGMTRYDALNELRRQMIAVSPFLADVAVLAFDIQRNELP